jgi:hypothetical protein
MRLLGLLAMGVVGTSVVAAPALAQPPALYDRFDDIFLGKVEPPGKLAYPDDVVERQAKLGRELVREVFDAYVFDQTPMVTADLANPFTQSVANEAGYYRVTGAVPTAASMSGEMGN